MSEVPGQSGLALLIYMALIAPSDFRVLAGLLRSSRAGASCRRRPVSLRVAFGQDEVDRANIFSEGV
jgi:hypothetical protein